MGSHKKKSRDGNFENGASFIKMCEVAKNFENLVVLWNNFFASLIASKGSTPASEIGLTVTVTCQVYFAGSQSSGDGGSQVSILYEHFSTFAYGWGCHFVTAAMLSWLGGELFATLRDHNA